MEECEAVFENKKLREENLVELNYLAIYKEIQLVCDVNHNSFGEVLEHVGSMGWLAISFAS